ncbi:LapA family protein [Saccharothrix australiensis]|uniref:Putative integral membrane protein n=1 Tax=Saccharothrix australiensis TaxID=2072 RepID=A0A495W2B8_9PSEU|nr:lipopolysaccharide assembly protein LapA domain-containing protein [Saccharothrix australiensis]RKT54008.1 putative integral membrane protein [Saccharothrix australiensis]
MTTPRDEDRTDAIPTAPVPDGPPPATVPVDGPDRTRRRKPRPTRISGTWVAVLASIAVLIVLLIFILQNIDDTTIHFLGVSSTLPLGVALLFAAIGGAITVALVGAARIMQLRRQAKRGLR